MHATITLTRPLQRDPLNRAAQMQVRSARLYTRLETVVSCPAHAGDLAELHHRCPRFFDGLLDLLKEAALPLPPTGSGCSLKRPKVFFLRNQSPSSAVRSSVPAGPSVLHPTPPAGARPDLEMPAPL